jgi:hypothetical protein
MSKPTPRNFIDLTGRNFGRLLVIERSNDHLLPCGSRVPRWLCKCLCGRRLTVIGQSLKSGATLSCGCWRLECRTTHGLSSTKLSGIYRTILYRINSGKGRDAPYRSMKLCEAWAEDFLAFRKWALSRGYKPGASIQRWDKRGDFTPENCYVVFDKSRKGTGPLVRLSAAV